MLLLQTLVTEKTSFCDLTWLHKIYFVSILYSENRQCRLALHYKYTLLLWK